MARFQPFSQNNTENHQVQANANAANRLKDIFKANESTQAGGHRNSFTAEGLLATAISQLAALTHKEELKTNETLLANLTAHRAAMAASATAAKAPGFSGG